MCLVGDQSTRLAAEFAEWMHRRRSAAAILKNPSPEEVGSFLNLNRTLVILGHDGLHLRVHSMRREANGGVWLQGDELGRRFRGVRQYLWACETMGAGSTRSDALADQARAAGAGRVAGHSVTLNADFDQLGGPFAEDFRSALAQLIWGFVDGEDDSSRLKLRAREMLPFSLDLDFDPSRLDWFRRKTWLEDRIQHFHIV